MALSATIYRFQVNLSDLERQVYEDFELRVARHPSESEIFLLTRLLAYCVHFEVGIQFSKGGLSSPKDPTVSVVDLTGQVKVWIEVGAPAGARLRKGAQACERVVVHAYKGARLVFAELAKETKAVQSRTEVWEIDAALLDALLPALDRNTSMSVVKDGESLAVTLGEVYAEGTIRRVLGNEGVRAR
jgi:uncharacterized protein YaeQ